MHIATSTIPYIFIIYTVSVEIKKNHFVISLKNNEVFFKFLFQNVRFHL